MRSPYLWCVAVGLLVCAALTLPTYAQEDRGFKPQAMTLESMKSESRLALVIGNANYDSSPLKNPPNDARLMAETLKSVGFELIGGGAHVDLSKEQMQKLIIDFGQRLRETRGVGLFYFAGHGMQHEGHNYLIPLKAPIEDEAHIKVYAVNVNEVLAGMEAADNRLNLLVLDACRDNPFARSFRSASRGLGKMDAPSGTMILYATRPGQVASDGQNGNGPFTRALATHIKRKGLKIEDVAKHTLRDVEYETAQKQTPWLEGALREDFYFVLPDQFTTASTPPAQPSCPPGQVFIQGQGCAAKSVPPGEAAAKEAKEVYLKAMRAFNANDVEGYLAAFAEPAQCIFGRSKVNRRTLRGMLGSQVESSSVYIGWLDVVSADEKEVALIDRGVWTREIEADVHEKAVLMRKVSGQWLIAGTTSLKATRCLGPQFASAKPSMQVKRCRLDSQECAEICDDRHHEPSNGWLMCRSSCSNTLAECMGVDFNAPP